MQVSVTKKILRTILRILLPSPKEVSMKILFGKSSLGWKKLPSKPGFISGKIFSNEFISLPWFTYPAISQLLRWSLTDQVIVEYGSGSSTKFFCDQDTKFVYSQEDNPQWFDYVKKTIANAKNIKYKLAKSKSEYVFSPADLNKIKPSIILIDGSHRADCATSTLEYILSIPNSKSPALIILDNSDWFKKPYEILLRLNQYIAIDFYGYGPYNTYSWCTTFFVNSSSFASEALFKSNKSIAAPAINGINTTLSADA